MRLCEAKPSFPGAFAAVLGLKPVPSPSLQTSTLGQQLLAGGEGYLVQKDRTRSATIRSHSGPLLWSLRVWKVLRFRHTVVCTFLRYPPLQSLNFPVSKHNRVRDSLCSNHSISPHSLSLLSSNKLLFIAGNLPRYTNLDHLSYHLYSSPSLILWNSTHHIPLPVFSCLSPPLNHELLKSKTWVWFLLVFWEHTRWPPSEY